jgi:hypothetical protein
MRAFPQWPAGVTESLELPPRRVPALAPDFRQRRIKVIYSN